MALRLCSRSGCATRASATLTYVYSDSTAVLGPLALQATPGSYDLCPRHAQGLSAPRGWEVIRLPDSDQEQSEPATDDLLALADAIRDVGMRCDEPDPASSDLGPGVVVLAEKRHLRVIADHDGSEPPQRTRP